MRLIPRLLALALLLPAAGGAQTTGQTPARTAAAQGGQFVLFSVKRYEQGAQIEPVVIVRRGAYVKPPVTESDAEGGDADAQAKKFISDYFRAGRRYRVISGGGEAGSLAVVKAIEPGCVGMLAEVTAQTTAKIGTQVQALATDSATVGRGEPARRAPTEVERAAALELARSAFTRAGVGPALLKQMEVVNLTAVDLDRDGRWELIGGFKVERTTEQAVDARTLFMILEPAGEGLTPALTWSHRGGEGEYQERRLVDYADLDGDGVAEVIAEGIYYESNDYFIYKKQQGRWRSVYQGGGGGC